MIKGFLEEKSLLFDVAAQHEGPVHVLFPQVLGGNFERFKKVFTDLGVAVEVFYAHKANKSTALAAEFLKNGANIEVASKNELISALSVGFTGEKILLTGIKTKELLFLGLQHGVSISIDSRFELESVIALMPDANPSRKIRVLLRLADPRAKDRNVKARFSRFGISQDSLPEIYGMLRSIPTLEFAGFHVHYYEGNADTYAGFVENMITLIEEAHREGFHPDVIDIGGGFRAQVLENYNEWMQFVENIETALLTQGSTEAWRNFSYGMYLNDKGKVSGREKLQAKFSNDDYETRIKEILGNESLRGRKLSDIIAENLFTVYAEPGIALLDQAGISIVKVSGVKEAANGEKIVLTNSTMFNFSYGAFEIFLDPILISKDKNDEAFSGYIAGYTCKEEDFILSRKIPFSSTPKPGDLLCFINTAAYVSGFVDGAPHMHPRGESIIAVKEKDRFRIFSESVYHPFITP